LPGSTKNPGVSDGKQAEWVGPWKAGIDTVGKPDVFTTVVTPDCVTASTSPEWLDTAYSLPSGPKIGEAKPDPVFAKMLDMAPPPAAVARILPGWRGETTPMFSFTPTLWLPCQTA
jgi:hypothetical protein